MTKRAPRKQKHTESRLISPARKRAFTIVTVLFPVVLFGLLEAGLRIAGFGPNLALFTTEIIGGRTYHIMNPDVKNRYFSHVEFSPNTSPDYFLMPKPAGTYRIFFLGGSTTVGFPYGYAGAPSSYLRDRLQMLFPERNIEIVNLGMTATNSYTVNDVARELVDYQPDLFIVYDGHNEYYGALGIASHESIGGARWLTKLFLRCVHLKTFQLLRDFLRAITGIVSGPAPSAGRGTMMERLARGNLIPHRSTAYAEGMEIFRENLAELKELCRTAGIPCILSSQASNLRDRPPFVSYDEETPGAHRFDETLSRSARLIDRREFDSALVLLNEAVASDSLRADLNFFLARCYDHLRNFDRARAYYKLARDHDLLRFRASADCNTIIREACDNTTFFLADIEQTFSAASPDSLIGTNLILEHLHPNASGYFSMGGTYARVMRSGGFLAPEAEWKLRDTIPEDILQQRGHLTQLDERCAQRRTTLLVAGWPFRTTKQPVPPVAKDDQLGLIAEQLVNGETTWEEAHVAAAEMYVGRGDRENAAIEYRALVNQIPLNVSAYLLLGQLKLTTGRFEEAEEVLKRSLEAESTYTAFTMLGRMNLLKRNYVQAKERFREAYRHGRSAGDRVASSYMIAVVLAESGENEPAISQLRATLSLNPSYKPALELLQRLGAKN